MITKIISVFFFACLIESTAYGLSCETPKGPYLSSWANIFTGKVISNDKKLVKFKILKSYRGIKEKEVRVAFKSELAEAAYSLDIFEVGKVYVITSGNKGKDDNIFDLGVCGIYEELNSANAKPVIKYLESKEFQKRK